MEQRVRDLSRQLQGLAVDLNDAADRIAAAQETPDCGTMPADLLARCRLIREHRRCRRAYFPAELFHEPAWDMLLTLYVARVERRTMYVKTLVLAADAPITTSQRWIEQLSRLGLVVRTEDVADRRRIEVALSEGAAASIERYLTELP
ncbi:hypothetical protein [Sphingomonas montana]|uniref:hypothetical protein n=1 Tax=Sphingomonas montana TaxID=1843236 RepID=UPI00096DC127|nr:hypothetical protein [Sphingomonas montana]